MSLPQNDILLTIEGENVPYNKALLVANSDFFKAMIEGPFCERDSDVIKLQGDVTRRSFDLTYSLLLTGNAPEIEFDDLLSVLKTASMFQFLWIKEQCIDQLNELLRPDNCIQIWKLTEQEDIKPLYLKARCMALEEFTYIKTMEKIPPLHLHEICVYLGNKGLNVDNEIDVVSPALQWWYVNKNNTYDEELTYKTLLRLLSCIVYKDMNEHCIREIITYPDIGNNSKLTSVLEAVIQLHQNTEINNISEEILNTAKQLWSASSRKLNVLPCILFEDITLTEDPATRIFRDKYKRKRQQTILENTASSSVIIASYDPEKQEFQEMLQMDRSKYQNLDGFKLLGHKEYVFIFGGEYLIGNGDWNNNFWVYDTFKEKWQIKTRLPYARRHFESCIVGNFVHIIGGTGAYRVIQENMFSYNFKEDFWSNSQRVPCQGRQVRCCGFQNELFLLDLRNKVGYLHNRINFEWANISIEISNEVLNSLSEFTMFSFKDSIYVKGKVLIKLHLEENVFRAVYIKDVDTFIPCDKMESALCNNLVYTLYLYRMEGLFKYVLEEYDLETFNVNILFSKSSEESVINLNNKDYTVSPALKLFPFQHYTFIKDDNEIVNDNFFE